ncbi:MAG: hypothetical protein B6I35_15605 [Anaerolineaceae bacterium 4572_32.2]|nr:MAG: hypothetical protein B6I35_15605 [Anaerolineaceae bacterium 4572_32.2]
MRALVIYHSTSGNTRLAASYLARRLSEQDVESETWDIVRKPYPPELKDYTLVGFGFPVMEFHPSYAIRRFVSLLPMQQGKPAFVFATCAGMPSNSLHMLGQKLKERGFVIVGGQAVTFTSNWPLSRQIVARRTANPQSRLDRIFDALWNRSDRPSDKDRRQLDKLVERVLDRIAKTPQPARLPHCRLDPFGWLGQMMTPERSRKGMGIKAIDETLCTQCGICARDCPAKAITLEPYPVFNEDECQGCWSCFNNCPEKALYTSLVKGKGHYAGPGPEARQLFS